MSDSSGANEKNTEQENGLKLSDRIGLKSIANIESLPLKTINEVLSDAKYWIENFYNVSAGDKKVTCKITVKKPETGHFSDSIFDLSRAEDLMGTSPKIKNPDDQPYIFLSDLLNFVEEIRTSIKKNTNLKKPGPSKTNFGNKLDQLGSVFEWIGVHLVNKKISLDDLKRIENPLMTSRIIGLIDEISEILQPVIGPLDIEKSKIDDEKPEEATVNGGSGLPLGGGSSQSTEPDQGGGEEPNADPDRTDPDRKRPDQPPDQPQPGTPFKISELDSESKLYLQSLSIITINQALGRYFNDASLAEMGFKPGTRVTFDQLPLDVRQQLMDRAFLQVETALMTGDFNLQDLIKGTSSRISFTNQTALSLLIDIRGMTLLNQAVASVVNKDKNDDAFKEKLSENQKQELKEEQLSGRVKNEKKVGNEKNITTTSEAEAKIASLQTDSAFIERIGEQLDIVSNQGQLDEKLREQFGEIFNEKSKLPSEITKRLIFNLSSLVDVYIQQGLPPEYLINDPNNFDAQKLKNFFGTDLTPQQLEDNKIALANIIVFYWKRKRILWAREFRQEFAQEKYTPEEAIALAAKHGLLPTKQQLDLRQLNTVFRSETVAEALANPNSDTVKNNKNLSAFVAQQQDLIGKQLTAELEKLGAAEQQATLKVYFEFYMPGATVYTTQMFVEQIVPQISPMDYYILMANTHSEAGTFNRDQKSGMMQQAFAMMGGAGGGGGDGDNLIKNDLTRKGLEWGIRAAAGAASAGASEAAFQALDKAEALDQTGFVKWFKEQILNKILDWIQKYWPILLATAAFAIFGPLLGALAAAFAGYKTLQSILGVGAKEQVLGGIEAANQAGQAAAAQNAINQNIATQQTLASQQAAAAANQAAVQNASAVTHGIGTTAMTTAGQAIIATVAATTAFTFFYQTSLNSAFLVDFPKNETELNGNTSTDKKSKYAEMTKTAVIKTGCAAPENNGAKCVQPSFPLSIEYTVVIKPKEDFSIQITNIEDTIKFKQSKKGWEKAGQAPPAIPSEKFLDFIYFQDLIKEQVGLSDTPLNTVSAVPSSAVPSEMPTETPIIITAAPTNEYIVIPAGGSLTFTYTLDDLTSGYNHTAINNTIEAKFNYSNSYLSGSDSVITGARVCLGECGGDAGCWPTTGKLWQLPFGEGSSNGDTTHRPPNAGGWGDSYDIGCSSCSGGGAYGPTVYANFDGNMCFKGCDNNQYGCRYILTFEREGQTFYEDFAHFQEPNSQLNVPGTCKEVEAGWPIGPMSNRGIGDVHLHFGAVIDAGGGWWGSNPGLSLVQQWVPESNNPKTGAGSIPPKLYDNVTSCYGP